MEVKYTTKGPCLPLEGMLGMSTHNWSCAMGMPPCEKCLGSVPRYNPEVQNWNGQFFSIVQDVATEVGFIWLGEMDNHGLVDMERQESFLLWAGTGTSKEYFWQCNGTTGRISTSKCSAKSLGLTLLYVFCQFCFSWDITVLSSLLIVPPTLEFYLV